MLYRYIFCPLFVKYVTFNTTWAVVSIRKENLSDTIGWLIILHKSFQKYEYFKKKKKKVYGRINAANVKLGFDFFQTGNKICDRKN